MALVYDIESYECLECDEECIFYLEPGMDVDQWIYDRFCPGCGKCMGVCLCDEEGD